MIKKRYSLQKRLIIYISLFSVVLGCVLIFAAYRIALEEINEVLDKQMQSLAERIAENHPEPLQSEIDLGKQYSEEDLFVDIWSYTDTTTLHPQDVLVASVKKAGFYTHQPPYGTWLTYIIPGDQLQIQVSQQKNVRQDLALELAVNMFLPYVLFLPFAIFGLSWVIRRSFQPLIDFKTELASRKAQELKPIEMKEYPLELEPTIEEMNYLFGRISLAQQEQRQFVADSAHELRTPLTALNLQLQILLQQFPQSDALHNLSLGILRMQHLVNQLLSWLAKQDVTEGLTEPVQSLSLNQMTVACIEQLIQLALQKEIDLGVEQQQELLIQGQASALHSIIYNLIDNAIKYSPEHGVINVSILQQGQQAILQIEDSGVGIDPAQFNQIRQRFYRVHNHAEIGSGLGLSIVDKTTERLGGTLEFSKSSSLGGLCVQVKFALVEA
jgi:two-component system OmpR family sensor kinase